MYIVFFKIEFKKYKFDKKLQKIINQILKDVILQYNELSEENMKKRRINPFLYKIYNKYKKKDIRDILDFTQIIEFMQKYSKQFNKPIFHHSPDGYYILKL